MPTSESASLTVHLPSSSELAMSQDEEWCEVVQGGARRRIRFHDYEEIFAVEGLYEHLFYERLKCQSHTVVTDLLAEQVAAAEQDPACMSVLDLGAGNGMVGEELLRRGFGQVVGVDIVPAAGEATERDRPGVYADYFVCDLLSPPADVRAELEVADFAAMTSVAALGFGDVPPEVFQAAFDCVRPGGWVALTIKEDFLETTDASGFSAHIQRLLREGQLEERARRRYQHRLDVRGEPLHYIAMVGVKR
ncbi:MAG: class I SAM-dependent methyltransferase [Actinomycetota bacterium]|nr:class I SAM-dependent methyltransferase [Actinomycetota bacterium]